jgi:hypothetical protein
METRNHFVSGGNDVEHGASAESEQSVPLSYIRSLRDESLDMTVPHGPTSTVRHPGPVNIWLDNYLREMMQEEESEDEADLAESHEGDEKEEDVCEESSSSSVLPTRVSMAVPANVRGKLQYRPLNYSNHDRGYSDRFRLPLALADPSYASSSFSSSSSSSATAAKNPFDLGPKMRDAASKVNRRNVREGHVSSRQPERERVRDMYLFRAEIEKRVAESIRHITDIMES